MRLYRGGGSKKTPAHKGLVKERVGAQEFWWEETGHLTTTKRETKKSRC